MKIKSQIPALYEQLLSRKILNFNLNETKATCHNCAMAKPDLRRKTHYQAHLKCCTFTPFLPNYLVGAILHHQLPGALVLRARIQKRWGILPLGMVAPYSFQQEYLPAMKHRAGIQGFGQREDWLCPFYQKNTNDCGIWSFRNSTCSTFFCQSVEKKQGMQFWRSMKDYLFLVETALLEEVLVMKDFSPRQISELLTWVTMDEDYNGPKKDFLSQSLSRQLWNGYYDQQEEFFIDCYQMVQKIQRPELKQMLAQSLSVAEKQLHETIDLLNQERKGLS
jgi:Fe-S-cluster containining protein